MQDKQAQAKSPNKSNTSKDLLRVTGDGSRRAVVESLFRQPTKPPPEDGKPRTFKVARSPLLDQLSSFLPQMQTANTTVLSLPPEKLEEMDIENTDGCDKVVEMNVLMGEMDSDASDSEADNLEDSSSEDTDDEDEDSAMIGPVTEGNIKIPTEATGGRKGKRTLIEDLSAASTLLMESASDEANKSDSEMTIVSSSSGER